MLDATKIEQLQQAVAAQDWKAAAAVSLEIKLNARSAFDRACADALAQAVHANDVERIEDIIDELDCPGVQ